MFPWRTRYPLSWIPSKPVPTKNASCGHVLVQLAMTSPISLDSRVLEPGFAKVFSVLDLRASFQICSLRFPSCVRCMVF